MKYTLTITHDDTAWISPELQEFNNRIYKRKDHAKFAIEQALYVAVKAKAMLDVKAGNLARIWARDLDITHDSDHTYIFAGLTFNLKSSK